MSIQTVNPVNNKVIKSFEEMSDSAIDQAITVAESAFGNWKKTPYKLRSDLLHKVANLMREKKEVLAKMITLEMGKLLVQAEGEILLSADIFDYYAEHGEKFLADKILRNYVLKNAKP